MRTQPSPVGRSKIRCVLGRSTIIIYIEACGAQPPTDAYIKEVGSRPPANRGEPQVEATCNSHLQTHVASTVRQCQEGAGSQRRCPTPLRLRAARKWLLKRLRPAHLAEPQLQSEHPEANLAGAWRCCAKRPVLCVPRAGQLSPTRAWHSFLSADGQQSVAA